ncbi:MAG: hypothetical protein ACM3O7_03480 [Acidobacteriota bacterium]
MDARADRHPGGGDRSLGGRGPEGGTLTVLNQSWAREEIPGFWAPTLLMAGGGLATLSMAFTAARDWFRGHALALGTLEGLVALVGTVAVGLGVALLIP